MSLSELRELVMEYVAGELLMDRFRSCRFFARQGELEQLREDMFLVGKWLKVFQLHAGQRRGGPESLALVLSRAEQRLQLIGEHGRRLVPAGFGRVAAALLREEYIKVSAEESLVCPRHGDFTPLNVIAGDDGITVIDYLGCEDDCAGVDVMKMLVFLEDESRSLTTSSGKAATLRAAFLEGYGDLPALSRPVLVLCEAMQRLVSLWGGLSTRGGYPHHRWDNRARVNAHVQWFSDRASRPTLWPARS